MAIDPDYDVVVFGATGFTGGLTAEYLAEHAPDDLRLAVAGRNKSKLDALVERLGRDVPVLEADVTDAASMTAVAEATRVIATTVGPFISYGEPLVAACAAAGTAYLDLTGESEFIDTMYLRYHQRAVETGARLIHAAGFESIPYDLGVQYTVGQLPANVPITMTGMIRASGRPSGGTFGSTLTGLSRGRQSVQAHRARRRVEPRPPDRSVRYITGRIHRREGFWAVPLPTVDPQVVVRSAAALDEYGPDFRYSHYAAVKRLPMVVGGFAGVAGLMAAAQIPPLRRALQDRLAPGHGPDPERRARSWFRARFTGEGGGRRVRTEVSGGDPGYGETAKMLAESALCLALDDVPAVAGQTTTAAALGKHLRDRLVAAGIVFRTLSTEDY